MREILFRGKTFSSDEWVEGCLLYPVDMFTMICVPESREKTNFDFMHCTVDPETVGQFTGLYDKNGKRIFEGDVVRTQPFYDRVYSRKGKTKTHVGVVEHYIFPEYRSEWRVSIKDYQGFSVCDWSAFYQCEVIGNIHDNPELLEVTE